MAEFVLELLSEEIPARMQADAARRLAEGLHLLCAEARLDAGHVEGQAGPRRLAVLARGMAAASEALADERRGPREGAPESAVEGFARSAGMARDALVLRETPKGRFWFAEREMAARPAAEVLAERLPRLIEGFDWPKAMRWGAASARPGAPRWVRPLRRILCLLDDELVGFEALGLASGRQTEGHRWMAPEPFELGHARDYEAALAQARVVVSSDERRAWIVAGAREAAGAAGFQLVDDEALAAENAGLAEWPVPLVGRFDPAFLEVPPEIVALTLKTHQRCFALRDAGGRPAPAFVAIANLEAPDGGATIIGGNERVIAARLADARFFWEQDRAKSLETHAQGLGRMLFHEKLGTLADKTERVAALAARLADAVDDRAALWADLPTGYEEVDRALLDRAARLSRADLTTGSVGEFPELQGIVGGHLARRAGEPNALAEALAQFHAPAPRGPVAVLVALADRLDTLVAYFSIGEQPTGSRDPFALRRAGGSIVDMLLDERLPILLPDTDAHGVAGFLLDRLAHRLGQEGVGADRLAAVQAAFEGSTKTSLYDRAELARALDAFLASADGENLMAGYRRAVNILEAEGWAGGPGPDPRRFQHEAERALDDVLQPLGGDLGSALANGQWGLMFELLGAVRPLIDRFFESVRVNDPDPAIRANRLALLEQFRRRATDVADLSLIQGA